MPFSSNTAPGTHSVERWVPSPSCLGARRWKRRQRSVRRAAEGHRVSGNGPPLRVVGLILCVLVGSLVDALLTLEYLRRGGSEANPLMALALTYGPAAFLGLKMGLSGVGVWVLAAHQQVPLALRGLLGLAVVYGLLLVCHVVLRFHPHQ
jgi:hypothetical protein